ncbi:uncharacterized protein LOC103518142 [Diaphorina citri]|uniref:Uncharacterized protein LOC103518142 n=1 Tax=Diaphorina citri TaxID=121845 RepID=A0A3Q0JBK6_DIACI|nr:uncharacterized protein LOC103518142 [Diaphorina citri]
MQNFLIILSTIFGTHFLFSKVAGDPKCDITDPFNDPCGDAGLCSPQGSGYSCDCSKFKSTLYVPSQDPNSCGTKVQIFCRDDERAKCDKHGWCRTGYGGYSCLCDPGYHNQYCTGRSSGNMTYFQSPIVLFKNKAPIGSIRVIYILAQSIGTQPSFQIFDILEMILSARLRRRDVSQTPNLRSLRDISQVANYLQQDKLLWRHEVHQRAQDMAMVPSGRDFCVQQFQDEAFCSIIPHDVKPVIKLQYPATKKDTVEYIFDNEGNFRGQPSQYVIVLKNRGRLEFKQTLYFFNAAEGNRSSCIPHLKLQDCSLDIPYFQRDSIVLRSYISPSIFCDKAVSMYNVMFQWNLYAGFQKLFNSNFPFNEHKPTFSSSEQNIIIRPFTLYQDKTLPYNVHTVFLESKLTIESETYVNNAMCQFKVITLDLIITIKGGSYRTHNVRQNLILNASLSYDPNESPNDQDLIFSWDCRNQNGITPTFCDKRESSNPILTIRSDLLAKGDTLTFNLTVLDGYRELSGTAAQSVYLEDTSFEIICVKNCEVESKKTDAIYLKCLPYHADKTLVWTVSDSNVAKIRQPNTTPDIFIIKPNTLERGKGYVVTVADQNDKRYKSSFEIYVGEALKRGSCEIKPTNGTMGKTHFSIKCENYGEFGADYKLVYEFYQSDGTDLMILGFNYIGTIKSIVLTFGDVRVKIYDKLGNVIDERLTVQLENLETDDENIINITTTVEISRSLLDHPSMLRHIQVLTKMLPHINSTQKEASSLQIISEIGHVFDDIENTLNYLLIRQVLTTLKYFLNTLKQIGEDEHYLVHKIVKYTGQYLQQSIKSIYERDMMISEMDSIITDVNLYQTNQIIHECFALIEMNKDSLLEDQPKDGMEYGIRYYSYMTSTRYLINTLNYTGLTTQSRMFPQQQDVQFKSNMSESRIWNKIDSPERLSNLHHIPNDSNTYITLDNPFVDQFVQDTHLSLEVVILKKNLFWWFNPDVKPVIKLQYPATKKDTVEYIFDNDLDEPISIHLEVLNLSRADVKWNATKYEDHVATDVKNTGIVLDEPISIHLEVLNLSRADVKWNATKYEDHDATDVKNTGIGSHRIPDLTKWSAVYVKFKKASSAMNLIWTKEQRPSTDLFQNEPNMVANETSQFKSNMSESRIWNKIDSPERLSNLHHIPNNSNTYITLDKPFADQFVQDTNLSLEVVILKKNLFWWFNPDDFGVNTTICGIYLNRVENRDFKPIHILDEPISIHLEVLNLSRADVKWNATKYEDHVATDVKNTGIGSHRIPDLTKWSAVYVKFKKASSAMNLIWTKEQRPSTDLFQNEPNLVANETSEFLLLPRLNVTDPGGNGEDGDIGDYFVGIVPEQKGNHEYTFEIYRIDCRRWINDKWIIDPYCMVNNRSTLDRIICDCRHMSKFSASVLVVPNLVDPIGDASLLLTVLDNPTPVIFVLTILLLYVILLIWARRKDKMDTKRVVPNLVDPIGDASLLLTVLDNPTPVIFVLAILLLYVILLIWARRKDKMDTKRGRIVILKDNCPSDEVPYLVTVYTGSRPYAGTTSDVCIQIFGTHGVSRVHLIQNPNKFTLQRGNDDWFLVLTPHHLGDIKRIRLWSNYSGKRPDWYCDQVEVRDIGTRKKYLFFVQRWLAVLKDEEFLEAEVLTHDKVGPRNIWTKMWERNVKSTIQEQHPAASFLIRHPRTAGTRVEKLSIVVSGIMTILVISLMFYEKSETDEETYEFFEYRLRDLVIGWESMVVEFITMGIIMYCFGKSRADTSKIKETIQVVDEDELIENKEDKEQNNSSNSKEKDASDKHGEHDGENREGLFWKISRRYK